MNAAYHLSTSWTHWLFAGLIVVTAAVGLVGLAMSAKREPPPYEPPSQSHVDIVKVPYDWAEDD